MPLSFFSNASGSYTSSVPFQRIVDPSQLGFTLNLEQSELIRIQRYNEAWRFYLGQQWAFKREDGDALVTFNYFRKIVDKGVEFLVSKGFVIRTPESMEQVTKPFLDEVWEYNQRDQIIWDFGTMGGVTGDMFTLVTYEDPTPMQKRINPFSEGRIRINLLGSEQVFPTWDPLNTNTLIAVRIETIYYAERGVRQLDRDDRVNHEGRQLYTKRFTQIITREQIIEQFHGDQPVVRPNILGEIPIVHVKNLPFPKEYYGLADGQDLIDIQRELNEKATDISDIVNYHASPITVVYGAKAKQLERSPRKIWSGLPVNGKVEMLRLEGDLSASQNYIEFVKKALHELSDTPEGALGAMQPISNTSGVALHMQYQPLIGKTKKKKAQYEPGMEQINYFILRIAMVKGLINLPFDVCSECNGRIIEVETGEMTEVWDPRVSNPANPAAPGAFRKIPIKKKRCYHIDPETLDFLSPYDMRIKYWRQYGFGAELREMQLKQIIDEIKNAKRSFWDYTELQEKMLEKWRTDNAAKIQGAHSEGVKNMTPPKPKPVAKWQKEEPQEQPEGPYLPPKHPSLIPQVNIAPPKVEPPPMFHIHPLPDGEIDVPEEPETVEVAKTFVSPETGLVMKVVNETKFLVPTGCKRPKYLNPFETQVEFNDVLPKDEALQAQLFSQYQANEWVDAVWCQEQIPSVAKDMLDINKRIKARKAEEQRLAIQTQGGTQPAATMPGDPMQGTPWSGDMAPEGENLNAVPGAGGNPVPAVGGGNGNSE